MTLAGDQEVPSIKGAGTGTGTITVGADKSVQGSVTTTGIAGTAAHNHEAAAAKNGPVVIPLDKNGDTYAGAANAQPTDAQLARFKAGTLDVNVHTAVHPDGEIRARVKRRHRISIVHNRPTSRSGASRSGASEWEVTMTGTAPGQIASLHTRPQLPCAEKSLAPMGTANILRYHHGKHPTSCLDNLDTWVAGTYLEIVSTGRIGDESVR